MSTVTKPIVLDETGKRIAQAIEALEAIGRPTQEQTELAVNKWLDDHPEATTTVQDESLTEGKFSPPLVLKTIKNYITPQMYGAKADGVADDASAINIAAQDAIEKGAMLYFPTGDYKCGSSIDLRYIQRVRSDGKIVLDNSEDYVTVGDTSRNGTLCEIHIASATRVKVLGLLDSTVYVGYAQELLLYADGDDTTDNAIAYNSIRGEFISTVTLLSNKSAASPGWINDNIFDVRRIINITIDGNYKHNNNVFRNCGIEGPTASINIPSGHSNLIICRGESLPLANITIGADCYNNQILKSWGSSGITAGLIDHAIGISKKNYYGMTWDQNRHYYSIINIDRNHKRFTGMQGYVTESGKLYAYSGQTHVKVDKYALPNSSEIEVVMSASDARFGLKNITLYDENLSPLTLSASIVSGGGINSFYGQTTANLTAGAYKILNFTILDPQTVRYISFELITVSGYSGEFEFVNVKLVTNKLLGYTPVMAPIESRSESASAPVRGVWEIGEIVYNRTPMSGSNLGWICIGAGSPGTWMPFGPTDYVTPQMFGAKADNSTDDTAAFRNAITSGKKVVVPPGTYKLTSAGFNLLNDICMDGAIINIVPSANISYIFKTGSHTITGGTIEVANTEYSVGGIAVNGQCKVSHISLFNFTAPVLKNESNTFYSVFESIMVGHRGSSTNVITGNVVDFDNNNVPNCNVFNACAFNARCTGVKVALSGRNNEMHGCDISFAASSDSATALLSVSGTSNVIDFYAEGTIPDASLPVVIVDGSSCVINCSGAFDNNTQYQDNGTLNSITFGVMGQNGNNNFMFNAGHWRSIDLYGKYTTAQSPYNSSYSFAKINDDRIESILNLGDIHQTATVTNTGILLTGENSDTQCMLNFNLKKTAVPDAYNSAGTFKGMVEFDVTAPSTFYVVGQTRTSNGERVHVKLNGDQAREVKVSKAPGSLLIENVVFSWM